MLRSVLRVRGRAEAFDQILGLATGLGDRLWVIGNLERAILGLVVGVEADGDLRHSLQRLVGEIGEEQIPPWRSLRERLAVRARSARRSSSWSVPAWCTLAEPIWRNAVCVPA